MKPSDFRSSGIRSSDKRSPHHLPSLDAMLRRTYLGVVLTAVILAGISLTVGGGLALSRVAEHNLLLIGRSIVYAVETAVLFKDEEVTQELVDTVAFTEEVSFIEVTDIEGNLLAEWRQKSGLLGSTEHWIADLLLPSVMELDIHNEGDVIGQVRFGGSGRSLIAFLVSGSIILFISLLLSAIAAIFLSRRILQGIIGPVRNLANVAHRIRCERDFDTRLPPANIAELNELSKDFNELVEELGVWQASWREEKASLSHKAMHDSLTGLSNRELFESQLDLRVQEAKLKHQQLAVLYIDSDNFKQINDHFGHAEGDAVLVELAARMRRQVRYEDLVARLGGDEFAVLISPLRQTKDAGIVAEHIQASVQEPIILPGGVNLNVSVSIGVAIYPVHAESSGELLKWADQAMYKAKRSVDRAS